MSIPHYKPQHVIALATANHRRAICGRRRVDNLADLADPSAALVEATYILEALDAAGLHVTGKVEGEAEAKADAAALDVSALAQGDDPYFGERLPVGATLAEGFTESGPAEPIAGACSHPDIEQGDRGHFRCTSCGKVNSRLTAFRRESRSTAALGSDPGRPVPRHGSGP